MYIIKNCYCTACQTYYQGPRGRFPDEISIRRCDMCAKDTSENGAYEVKMKWRIRRDGTREKVKSVTYY